MTTNTDEYVEKGSLFTAGGNVSCHGHHGNKCKLSKKKLNPRTTIRPIYITPEHRTKGLYILLEVLIHPCLLSSIHKN